MLVDDRWLVDQVYQLHLLQVQYVDTVVGQVIDRLETLGIYDDTMIVVVSDHGVTLQPGCAWRGSTPETVGDIPPVPLFIKIPRQTTGGFDDYRALTTDVIPTIVDVFDIEVDWEFDGTSLVADQRPDRTSTVVAGNEGPIELVADGSAALARAAEKIERFGSDGPFGLAPPVNATCSVTRSPRSPPATPSTGC